MASPICFDVGEVAQLVVRFLSEQVVPNVECGRGFSGLVRGGEFRILVSLHLEPDFLSISRCI